jgi:hypothetical protein
VAETSTSPTVLDVREANAWPVTSVRPPSVIVTVPVARCRQTRIALDYP